MKYLRTPFYICGSVSCMVKPTNTLTGTCHCCTLSLRRVLIANLSHMKMPPRDQTKAIEFMAASGTRERRLKRSALQARRPNQSRRLQVTPAANQDLPHTLPTNHPTWIRRDSVGGTQMSRGMGANPALPVMRRCVLMIMTRGVRGDLIISMVPVTRTVWPVGCHGLFSGKTCRR